MIKWKTNVVWVSLQALCFVGAFSGAYLIGRSEIDALWFAGLIAISVFGWIICLYFGFDEEK